MMMKPSGGGGRDGGGGGVGGGVRPHSTLVHLSRPLYFIKKKTRRGREKRMKNERAKEKQQWRLC